MRAFSPRSISVFAASLAALGLLAALYVLSRQNYLLFHSGIELFAVAIAFSVFFIGWNTRHLDTDAVFFLIAIAYLAVGVLDTVHTLSYAGMGVFPERTPDLPTQLWIAARYLESLTFLAAAGILRTVWKPPHVPVLLVYGALTGGLLLLIISLRAFPVMYAPGQGLTAAKVASEYVICMILALSAALLWFQRERAGRQNTGFLLAAIGATMAAELSFTLYSDVYGFFNFLGHVFKLISFWCLYRALVSGLLKRPFESLFRQYGEALGHLRASESSLRAIFEHTTQLIGTLALDGTLLRANRTALQMIGAAEQDVLGRPFWECPWWRHSPRLQQQLRQSIEAAGQGRMVRFDATHVAADGQERMVDFSISPIYDGGGKIISLLAESTDVTELKTGQEQLRRAYNKLDKLIALNLDGVLVTDMEGVILFVNPAGAQMMGRSEADLTGKPFGHPLTGETSAEIELLHPGGGIRIAEIRKRETEWEGVPAYLLSLRDITDRKQSEEALQRSEEKYRNILESMEEGYFEVDLAGNFTFYNDAMHRILGYSREELTGMNYKAFMREETASDIFSFYNRIYRTATSEKAYDWELIRRSGAPIYVDTSVSLKRDARGEPIGFKGVVRDVTERKKAEAEREHLQAQLRHAQQVEAIGTMAGGIAHDFNNILSSILGYAELSIDEIPKDSHLHQNLSQVLTAGYRAKDLVKQILTLSRQQEQEYAPTPVVQLVKEAMKMLRSTVPTSIDFRENISDDRLIVEADATQLHQVIVNLVTNARDAMPEEGGVLTVSVAAVNLDDGIRKEYPDAAPGRYARIAVSDTGHGISPEFQSKIFEPYFTTKKKGMGTGLGLSVVHSIVKNHLGLITVDSAPEIGTTFEVYLPLAPEDRPGKPERAAAQLPTGTESILVVDDELPIVKMKQKILERLGYRVIPRTSSVEALEAFRANPGRFDLVITDMTMPNMSGERLALAIRAERDDVPVILCTGFSQKLDALKNRPEIAEVLLKPVEKAEMAEAVRSVLDGAANST